MKLRCDISCGPEWSVRNTDRYGDTWIKFFANESDARAYGNKLYRDPNIVMVALWNKGTEIKCIYKEV
jgi:hypothetical protein